jgi:hypothetical protein
MMPSDGIFHTLRKKSGYPLEMDDPIHLLNYIGIAKELNKNKTYGKITITEKMLYKLSYHIQYYLEVIFSILFKLFTI